MLDFCLSATPLFRGTTETEAMEMLRCLGSHSRQYSRGDVICRAGVCVEHMGLVCTGSVNIERDDIWGNKSILAHMEAGQAFAETYACIPGEPLMVNVVASDKCEVLFLNAARLLTTCSSACEHHNRLIKNLLQISAQKSLTLSRRILHTAPKSIRGRLLSYLSEQAKKSGGCRFTIPFNRQQLADYLGVDRSALSNELSKLRREGVLDFEKNSFVVRRTLA